MTFILSLLSSKTTWIFIVAGLIAVAFSVQGLRISHLKSQVESAKSEVQSANLLIEQAKQTNLNLIEVINRQNTAIDNYKSQVADRTKRATEAIRKAAIQTAKSEDLAHAIELMELSQDECTALRSLLDSYSLH